MKFSPNLALETASVLDPVEDGHWLPGASVGSVRVELVERTTFQPASALGGAELASVRLSVARAHRSSLLRAGRFLQVRGRTYRIESVIEERDGAQRYHSMTLKEVQ